LSQVLVDPPRLTGGGPLGQLRFFAEHPLEIFLRANALGGVVRMRLATKPAFIVSSPEAIRQVLVDKVADYQKKTRGYNKLRLLLGDGLVTSEGEFWLRQRRIAQPAFSKHRLAHFADAMIVAAQDQLTAWAGPAERREVVDVAEAMNRLALRIAGETLVGQDVTGAAAEIGRSLLQILERFPSLVSSPLPWPEHWPLPQNRPFWKGIRTIHRVVDEVIATRRRGEAGSDLLGLLMAARDPETGEAMTDRQLRDEVITMLLAGHETTANALAWTLHLLATHPEIQDRVAAEAQAVLGAATVTADDLPKLVWLRQVFQESLRLYPPIWLIARRAEVADVLAGVPIPAGAYLFISPWAAHRRPEAWPEPERFLPERFDPSQPPPDRFTWLPFSRGRRQCIGDRFAEIEALIILAELVRRFRFLPVPGRAPVPEPSVTLRPGGGLVLQVEVR